MLKLLSQETQPHTVELLIYKELFGILLEHFPIADVNI